MVERPPESLGDHRRLWGDHRRSSEVIGDHRRSSEIIGPGEIIGGAFYFSLLLARG